MELIQKLPNDYNDHQDIGKKQEKTEREKVLTKTHETFLEHARKGKPYCYRCFKKDYEKRQAEEHPRQPQNDERNVKIKYDRKPYGDQKRFVELRRNLVRKHKVVDGQKIYFETYYVQFQCRVCGGRLDIEELPTTTEKE